MRWVVLLAALLGGCTLARDFDQIQRAQLDSQGAVAADNTLSLPPGYIQGFDVTLRKDYTVVISGGSANVGGRQVKHETDHQLTLQDWVAPRMDTPQHYYIYLSKDGNIYVDIVKPKNNSYYGYYEQPDTGWRVIGKMFVKSTDIIYAIRDVGRSGRSVTVAPADYIGYADYYCDGENDEILINAAITYVFNAYGGGSVSLLEGVFNVDSSNISSGSGYPCINLLAYVSLSGAGSGTVLKYGGTRNSYFVIRIAGVNCTVKNLKILSSSAANSGSGIACVNSDSSNLVISNVEVMSETGTTVLGSGISVGSTSGSTKVVDCYIHAVDSGIYNGGPNTVILSNVLESNINGIYNAGPVSHYVKIESNRCISNTSYGIYNDASNTNASITSNYCFNNGLDTGIANTNSNNFYDVGTDTQVYSNSWQNPNSGEPNQGELHWKPMATNTTSGLLVSAVTTTAAWSSISFGGILPVGSRSALCFVRLQANSSAAGVFEHQCSFSNDTTATPAFGTRQPMAGVTSYAAGAAEVARSYAQMEIPLDSNLKSYFYAVSRTNATACQLSLAVNGYNS